MDKIQRFIFEKGQVRGEIVRLSESYQQIIKQHAYPEAIGKLLGQILAVSCLLCSIIKFKGRLTVQFQGKPPLKLILAQCNNEFELRGLAQWEKENLTEDELLKALQQGTLAIIIHSNTTTKPYQGIVEWQGNSIAQSIEGYFKDSEQLSTRLWLAVDEKEVVGLLLQPLPAEGLKHTSPIAGGQDFDHLVFLTDTLTPAEMISYSNETLLYKLYSQEEIRLFEAYPVSFKCTCSYSRSENAVLMLGKEEADQELLDKDKIVVTCEFCNREYIFDKVDVANIFKKNNSSNQMH